MVNSSAEPECYEQWIAQLLSLRDSNFWVVLPCYNRNGWLGVKHQVTSVWWNTKILTSERWIAHLLKLRASKLWAVNSSAVKIKSQYIQSDSSQPLSCVNREVQVGSYVPSWIVFCFRWSQHLVLWSLCLRLSCSLQLLVHVPVQVHDDMSVSCLCKYAGLLRDGSPKIIYYNQ